MQILERFPRLRSLMSLDIEWLGQSVVMRIADSLRDRPDSRLEARLTTFCRTRDERMEQARNETLIGSGDSQLEPDQNEEQRDAIAEQIDASVARLDFDTQLCLSLEFYELAAREEGPPDPILLATLEERIRENEANPGQSFTMDELRERMKKIAEELKRKRKENQ